jgi:hypothetical protein
MRLQVPESGALRLAPLPAGSYAVFAKRGLPSRGVEPVGQTVTLSGRTARVRITP